MKATIERLETVHTSPYAVTPVLWRCGELVGIARIDIVTPLGVIRIGG